MARKAFSSYLAGGIAKTDNASSATTAKVAIRSNVLQHIGDETHVFDAFAGEGHMHAAVWIRATSCTGCDERFFRDDRLAYVADNRRVLRTIDLARINIFDLDAYGSPWEQAVIIARRRSLQPGERLGLVITDGSGMKIKMGGVPRALQLLSGMKARPGLAKGSAQTELIGRALRSAARIMGGELTKQWIAEGKLGSKMFYVGVIIEGKA
jgi:hypothetical protein